MALVLTGNFTSRVESSITGAYLMSFHACDSATTNCRDPRSHQVYLAESDDGVAWRLVPDWRPVRGSVPDVIRRGNTLYVYSAGGGGLVRYRLDTNTQEPAVNVTVRGLQEGFVDPSLFLDDQGRLVLFFLYGRVGSDPAGCPAGQTSCVNRFGSATEVAGSDGAEFTLDEGDRASITLSTSGPIRSASDPDVFFDGARYVMYISHGPSLSVWVSHELRGSYNKLADLNANTGGIPSGHFDSTSKRYWTYSHVQRAGAAIIRRAVHRDFSQPLGESDWTTVLSGPSVGLSATTTVESAGFALNAAGPPAPPSACALLPDPVADPARLPLLAQARAATPTRYQFALDRGARILQTPDGRSFYLLWLPSRENASACPPMIVTLHGSSSWAFDEFFLWQSYAAERGYGILPLQWWFGSGEQTSDYYTPQQAYTIIEAALRGMGVPPGRSLVHGNAALDAFERRLGSRESVRPAHLGIVPMYFFRVHDALLQG